MNPEQQLKQAIYLLRVTYRRLSDPKVLRLVLNELNELTKKLESTPTTKKIQKLAQDSKKAPMEFERKQAMVIADNDYNLQILTPQLLESFIKQLREEHKVLEQKE